LDVVWGEEGKSWRRSFAAFDGRSITKAAAVRKYISTSTIGAMRAILVVLGVLLGLAGLVWVAQGLNLPFAPRSFMTADRTWIVIGAVAMLAGGVLVWWGRRTA
jgi:hypothetical protein